ncbi:hypothetical protein A0J61_10899 [Choanephora cucurbitarum]|uniref:Uncharacterized protein n=1 Tax=Choanephora cucurbitarum TaxID=101091 RepID=A0A1C7MW77_9FUNG|nr:hypothetical protein A0J61_10899 [Choanephora cucurbitarum]
MIQFVRKIPDRVSKVSMDFAAENNLDLRRYNMQWILILNDDEHGGLQRISELNQIYGHTAYVLPFSDN